MRGLLEGLTLAGTLNANDTLVVIGGMEMKAQGEPATVQATLEIKKQTLLVRHSEVRLPWAAASLRGKLALQTSRPRYDLKAALHIDVDGRSMEGRSSLSPLQVSADRNPPPERLGGQGPPEGE